MNADTTVMVPDRAAKPCNDAGFTLVEAVVALHILGIIFTALAYAATGALRASLNNRAEQQAIDFATEALETARQSDYYSLANLPTVCGTAVVAGEADKCIDPGTGSERIITSSIKDLHSDRIVSLVIQFVSGAPSVVGLEPEQRCRSIKALGREAHIITSDDPRAVSESLARAGCPGLEVTAAEPHTR